MTFKSFVHRHIIFFFLIFVTVKSVVNRHDFCDIHVLCKQAYNLFLLGFYNIQVYSD